jgi:predicted nucleotidyltransferase
MLQHTHISELVIPERALREFCQRNQIQWLALFGSALREDFTPESDIDLLVDFEPEAQISFLDLSRMQRQLAELWGRPVDLVPRQGLKPLIRQQILADAQILYAT